MPRGLFKLNTAGNKKTNEFIIQFIPPQLCSPLTEQTYINTKRIGWSSDPIEPECPRMPIMPGTPSKPVLL